jgi:hypothetical protein
MGIMIVTMTTMNTPTTTMAMRVATMRIAIAKRAR